MRPMPKVCSVLPAAAGPAAPCRAPGGCSGHHPTGTRCHRPGCARRAVPSAAALSQTLPSDVWGWSCRQVAGDRRQEQGAQQFPWRCLRKTRAQATSALHMKIIFSLKGELHCNTGLSFAAILLSRHLAPGDRQDLYPASRGIQEWMGTQSSQSHEHRRLPDTEVVFPWLRRQGRNSLSPFCAAGISFLQLGLKDCFISGPLWRCW